MFLGAAALLVVLSLFSVGESDEWAGFVLVCALTLVGGVPLVRSAIHRRSGRAKGRFSD